jgi:hypothetical protein
VLGRVMMKRHRHRSTTARAPAAPRDRAPRSRQVPTGDDQHFAWRPGELVERGHKPLEDILRDCWTVVGPSGRRK